MGNKESRQETPEVQPSYQSFGTRILYRQTKSGKHGVMNWGSKFSAQRPLGLVLGSGLDSLAQRVEITHCWDYDDIAEIPAGEVQGHAGQLVAGSLFGVSVLVARGRRHLYEGRDGPAVAAIVRELHARGVRRVVLTNAAGCLRAEWQVGEWMVLSDQLNLTGTSPLRGPSFVDCSSLYPQQLREELHAAGADCGVRLREGVYAGLRGPQYETPAEIVMLRRMGADAVGMSTVLEAIQARALGMEVVGLSCLSNYAAGMSAELAHEEVIAVGRAAAESLALVLENLLGK